ncbi:winged helix-turn-helix domain-containing protein [Paradevosia shaoguanensis]|uniref:winged helix-turn-helix domain-containing protein n=1 Tax=Paradevosia shaoguanensis TaxID=1335043 RepID=UPI001933037B|nr:winged helix DNA-binding domain-containing protein [Paradevosia shaoguanensis]
MPAKASRIRTITPSQARRIWLHAQRLDEAAPFGEGPEATRLAVEHLGYVQIDTINVIERSHHHILFSRIPGYRRGDLRQAQSMDKSVFEYWTHALSYVPTRDLRFFLPEMKRHKTEPSRWYADANPNDLKRMLRNIRKDGALSIRDIDDDELVEKDHPWASRKPSKRVLQLGFYNGDLAISERNGMVKTYELMERHFGWNQRPKAATDKQVAEYLLDRALRSQGLVSLESISYLEAKRKPVFKELIEGRVRRRQLVPVTIEGVEKPQFWATPEVLDAMPEPGQELVHILSPFDPLIIQRKRTSAIFGYDHLFEAYVPKAKRKYGYFSLPVLVGEEIVAALDLKTDRAVRKVLIQNWTWVRPDESGRLKGIVEEALGRFEAFQLGD